MQTSAYVHCMLIPLSQHYLLLPNTTIAEVIPMPKLAEIEQTDEVILGHTQWREQTLPVIDISQLIADKLKRSERTPQSPKLCIINSIRAETTLKTYAAPCSGVPQLITLNESALHAVPDANINQWVHSQLKIGNKIAFIPNLDAIETYLKNHFQTP